MGTSNLGNPKVGRSGVINYLERLRWSSDFKDTKVLSVGIVLDENRFISFFVGVIACLDKVSASKVMVAFVVTTDLHQFLLLVALWHLVRQ